MDSGSQRYRIVVYGRGAVGLALGRILGGIPVLSRTKRLSADYSLVCWPANAIDTDGVEFNDTKVTTFCNGTWVPKNIGSMGCAYIRATTSGYTGSPKWRVEDQELAAVMRSLGAQVTATKGDHREYVWGKAMYLLPLALACQDTKNTAKEVAESVEWCEYYDIVKEAARKEVGLAVNSQEKRVMWLLSRLPRRWSPSPSKDELAYFRNKLGISC